MAEIGQIESGAPCFSPANSFMGNTMANNTSIILGRLTDFSAVRGKTPGSWYPGWPEMMVMKKIWRTVSKRQMQIADVPKNSQTKVDNDRNGKQG